MARVLVGRRQHETTLIHGAFDPSHLSQSSAGFLHGTKAKEHRKDRLFFSRMKTCLVIPSRFTPGKGPQSAGSRRMTTLMKLLPDRNAAFTSAQINCQLFHFVKVNNHSLACLDAVGEALLSVIRIFIAT